MRRDACPTDATRGEARLPGRRAGDGASRNEGIAGRAGHGSTSTAGRRRSTWWIAAVVAVFCLAGVVDYGIAARWAQTASSEVLQAVAARVGIGVHMADGRPAFDASVEPGRFADSASADPIRYVVRTRDGDYVAGDPDLGLDRFDPSRTEPVDRPHADGSLLHTFSRAVERRGSTFVVTVQETDARRGAAAWSFFRSLVWPTLVLPGTFVLFAWLIVRNEGRSMR